MSPSEMETVYLEMRSLTRGFGQTIPAVRFHTLRPFQNTMTALRTVPLLLLVILLVAGGCDTVDPQQTPDALSPDIDATETATALPSVAEIMARLDSMAVAKGYRTAAKSAPLREGAVYTLSNDASINEVIVFHRAIDGQLSRAESYPTQGRGSGDGLNGTSNPLIVSDDNQYLFAVNGGSDEITAFRIEGTSLEFLDKVSSRGFRPISVTTFGDLVYVLNAGRDGFPGNITGFRFAGGQFVPIPSTRLPLNPNARNPSQIDFSPNGNFLIVTDKPTNTITTYRVGPTGVAGPPQPQPSNGETPFGFDTNGSFLFVSEAFGGAADGSALSSYQLNLDGSLHLISASVPTTETAACWVEVTENGRYAYVTNTGSGTITGYRIMADGSVERLDDDGVTATSGGGPLDMEMVGSSFMYIHVGTTNEILGYRVVEGTGELQPLAGTGTGDLPATTVGVAVTDAQDNGADLAGAGFVAVLNGQQQVPDPVDSSGGGIVGFRVNESGDGLLYLFALAGLEDVTQAHTHLGARGNNGPVTAFLLKFTEAVDGSGGGTPFTTDGLYQEFGLVTASDVVGPIEGDFRALIESMQDGEAYVNVHTVAFPAGEVRGQVGTLSQFLP